EPDSDIAPGAHPPAARGADSPGSIRGTLIPRPGGPSPGRRQRFPGRGRQASARRDRPAGQGGDTPMTVDRITNLRVTLKFCFCASLTEERLHEKEVKPAGGRRRVGCAGRVPDYSVLLEQSEQGRGG